MYDVIFRKDHYPFNRNLSDYLDEFKYKNKKRLAFVNDWAKKRLPKL